ncbi:MAG: stress response translation initiation inhibitor YciH [Candidatus Woesearchaeota archaeon]
MSDICTICGLPKELCVCETIAKENQSITAKLIKKKFGKKYTVIEGFNQSEIDVKEVAKKLKEKFACGGTSKDGIIELQGDHLKNVKQSLILLGFAPETIKVA